MRARELLIPVKVEIHDPERGIYYATRYKKLDIDVLKQMWRERKQTIYGLKELMRTIKDYINSRVNYIQDLNRFLEDYIKGEVNTKSGMKIKITVPSNEIENARKLLEKLSFSHFKAQARLQELERMETERKWTINDEVIEAIERFDNYIKNIEKELKEKISVHFTNAQETERTFEKAKTILDARRLEIYKTFSSDLKKILLGEVNEKERNKILQNQINYIDRIFSGFIKEKLFEESLTIYKIGMEKGKEIYKNLANLIDRFERKEIVLNKEWVNAVKRFSKLNTSFCRRYIDDRKQLDGFTKAQRETIDFFSYALYGKKARDLAKEVEKIPSKSKAEPEYWKYIDKESMEKTVENAFADWRNPEEKLSKEKFNNLVERLNKLNLKIKEYIEGYQKGTLQPDEATKIELFAMYKEYRMLSGQFYSFLQTNLNNMEKTLKAFISAFIIKPSARKLEAIWEELIKSEIIPYSILLSIISILKLSRIFLDFIEKERKAIDYIIENDFNLIL